MFQKSTGKITGWLCEKGIIKKSDYEVYEYGIQNLLTVLWNIVTFFAIGAIFHMAFRTLEFVLFYSVLRIYAGGYHANTPIKCYGISNLIILLFIFLFHYLPINKIGFSVVALICLIYIFCFSPVGTKNKPLDADERKHYKRKACIIIVIELLIQQITLWTGYTAQSKIIILAICAVCLMMGIGQIKNFYDAQSRKPQ